MCPRLPWSRVTLAVAIGACSLLSAGQSEAQVPLSQPIEAPAESTEAKARAHFDRALELYRAGRYPQALEELQLAAKLDPNGKDLFFNLALVHEKLTQLPEAITALERFRELETDAAERERARLTIERLRGAEKAARAQRSASPICPEPAAPPAAAAPGRPHVAMIGAASVAVVSLVVGAVFGIKALSDDVGHARTSSSLSVERLRERGRRAQREALVADIAFALSAASAGTFVGVWLLSPPDKPATERAAGFTLRSDF